MNMDDFFQEFIVSIWPQSQTASQIHNNSSIMIYSTDNADLASVD